MSGSVVSARLAELEGVIERGQQTFVEVGLALLEIRDQRLYKATHSSFDAYTRDRWGWNRAHAARQIEAASLVRELSPIGDILPANEAQARELAKATDPAAVWDNIVHAYEPSAITAAVIREHVDHRLPDPSYNPPPSEPRITPAGRADIQLRSAIRAALHVLSRDDIRRIVREEL